MWAWPELNQRGNLDAMITLNYKKNQFKTHLTKPDI